MRAIPSKTWFDVLLLLFFRFSGFFPKHPQTQAQKNNIYIYIPYHIYFLSTFSVFFVFVSERLFVMDAPVPSPVGRLVNLDGKHRGPGDPTPAQEPAQDRKSPWLVRRRAGAVSADGVGWWEGSPFWRGRKKLMPKILLGDFWDFFFLQNTTVDGSAATSWYDK